jgi:hypothetical protein
MVLGNVSFSITSTPVGVTVSDVTAETEVSTLVDLNQNYVIGLQEIFSGNPNISNELATDISNRSYSYLAFYRSLNSDSFPVTKTSSGNYNTSESTTNNVNVSYSRSHTGDFSATVSFAKAGYWRVVFIVSIKQPKRGTDGNIAYDNVGNIIYERILVADCEMDFIAAKINTPACKEKSYGMGKNSRIRKMVMLYGIVMSMNILPFTLHQILLMLNYTKKQYKPITMYNRH